MNKKLLSITIPNRGILLLLIYIITYSNISAQKKEESPNWHIPDLSETETNLISKDTYVEIEDVIPIRNTKYKIRVPKNWNGTLISDLDYYDAANSKKYLYLLEKGYAMSGTKRRPGRLSNYDPAHEIHDIISVLDIFEATFGKPGRTIQYGCSGGGTITLAIAEIHPDRFDGGIAGCGATSPWMANTHLDGLFVLKALIAPELPIIDLPLYNPEIGEVEKKWKEAISEAQKTPEGRARIALAITIGQWPAWGGPGEAPHYAPNEDDYLALQESMFNSLFMLLPSQGTFGTTMLELSGGGQLKSNDGIDYKELYNNGYEKYKSAVNKLYKEAGINLKDDLKKVNAFPRIEADAVAKKYWSAPGRTHIGEPKIPLLRIHTKGDGLVYPSMAQGYEDLIKANGYQDFYRSAFVERWGHCSFSISEFLSALETMEQRLDKGEWPDTSPKSMNERANKLLTNSESKFFEMERVEKYNRVWIPTKKEYLGE
ncbi:alpha/beta hydrolase family protein [Saccharicrinis aurantiacus]|uniref:alpha/beta hydrolase family protein n=1 Tax=Saccharicrinis aurantiacus TaxID=1849719 RepID=UPI002492D850|nr:alpha/beta hydrolase [Saccharicrinis aurantiacus]